MFISRPPTTRLMPFVTSIWYYESHHLHARETVLPNGRCQLLIDLTQSVPEATLRGAATERTTISAASMRRMIGVLFQPGGAFAVCPVPGIELRDGGARLDELTTSVEQRRMTGALVERLMGARAPALALTYLEEWLAVRLLPPTAELAMVQHAARLLRRGMRVGEVVDSLGVSRSRLVRTFALQTGMSPKQFASVSRFQRAVRALAAGEDDLAQVALACGYFDQAHFCHEFRRFSGRAPTAYRPRDPREPNHVLD